MPRFPYKFRLFYGLALAVIPLLAQADVNFIAIRPVVVDDPVARFVTSSPNPHETVHKAPASVTITFSRPVLAEDSYIKVSDLYGQSRDDGKLEISGNEMKIGLTRLTPGRYKVKWRAMCVCAGRRATEDRFTFSYQ